MYVQMAEVVCCECGIPFMITAELQWRLKESHNAFFCPRGHRQYYGSKTEIEMERERNAALRRELDEARIELARVKRTLPRAKPKRKARKK